MHEVIDILKSINIKLDPPPFKVGSHQVINEAITISFWTLYSQEEVLDITTMSSLYEMKTLP